MNCGFAKSVFNNFFGAGRLCFIKYAFLVLLLALGKNYFS